MEAASFECSSTATRARIVFPELFLEQLVAVYDTDAALTLVSEGKPRLRLLIGSKAGIFESMVEHERAPLRLDIV